MMPKSRSEFKDESTRPNPMRGEENAYQAKVAQEGPNSGNLVDDILNGRFEQHQNEADDLLGSGMDDLDDDLKSNDYPA